MSKRAAKPSTVRVARIFVGSSSESKGVVEAIHANLREFDVTPWPHAFGVGQTYTASLSHQMENADFAIFVISNDDLTTSRGQRKAAPRDNVIFELGLFIGKLGFDRCFSVVEESERGPKIPSDLAGVVFESYRASDDYEELKRFVAPACSAFRSAITKVGLRQAPSERLANGLQGFWYEKINPPIHKAAIGVLEFTKTPLGIKIRGQSFDAEGHLLSRWETTTSSTPNERTLLYSWQGTYEADRSERFDGNGEMEFQIDDSGGPLHGRSEFSESRMRPEEQVRRHTAKMSRCGKADMRILRGEDDDAIARLLKKRITTR